MSKKEKRIQRLFSDPPPKDYAWEELTAVMEQVGFEIKCAGGSHFSFTHKSGFVLTISRTHPSGILKVYQVKAAKEALSQIGIAG